MRFDPQTKEQLETANLLPDGQYTFEVIEAQDQVSKNGAEMIKLSLRIYDQHDRARVVYDYLLAAMQHKLFHFCEMAGLANKYADGSLQASDCVGKKGFVELYIQPDKTGQYGPKNSVRDYISNTQNKLPLAEKKDEFTDDLDIPF